MKKSLFLLWSIAVLSTLAGIPYAFDLQRDVVAKVPFPFPVFVLITLAQTALLLAVAVYLGAKAAGGIGLRVFALKEITPETNTAAKVRQILESGIPAGIIVGAVIYALDFLFLQKLTPELSVTTNAPALWKTLLASLYGGVVEEVLMRLFLLSLVAWILAKLFRPEKPVESKAIMWSAIIVSTAVFGLGHLPVTAALVSITPAVVARALLLNGVGGLVFGWLYWKKGLEYGIVAHFTTDLVLLAILPALLK